MDFEKIKNHKYYFEPISLDLIDNWFINEWPQKLKEIKEYNKTDKDSDGIFYLDMIFLNNLDTASTLLFQTRRSYVFLMEKIIHPKHGLMIWSDLFIEIESCIEYIIGLIDSDRNIFNSLERVHMNDVYFHKQMATYNYLFSNLDKIADLLFSSYNWNHETKIKTRDNNIYFLRDFKIIVQFYLKEKNKKNYNDFLDKVLSSDMWKYLKKTRDKQIHKFHDFPDTYNISCELMILLIFILRILYSIKINFKDKV